MRKLIFIFGLISLTACTKENEIIKEVEIFPEYEVLTAQIDCNACYSELDQVQTEVDGEQIELEFDTIVNENARFPIQMRFTQMFKDSIIITQVRRPPGYPEIILSITKFYRNGNTN